MRTIKNRLWRFLCAFGIHNWTAPYDSKDFKQLQLCKSCSMMRSKV